MVASRSEFSRCPGVVADAFDISVFRDFSAVESLWREFETAALMSPYQRFDFLCAWHRNLGVRADVAPLLIVGRHRGKVGFLWPMGIVRQGPWRIASWLGGKHSNYNMGLYTRAALEELARVDIRPLLDGASRLVGGIDVFRLVNQPESWAGLANPFLCLAHQPSPSFAYSLGLNEDFPALVKRLQSRHALKKRRWQIRKLDEAGGYHFETIADRATAHRVLDTFLAQKAARFAVLGGHNPFAEEGTPEFLHELVDRAAASGQPVLELAVLRVADRILAVFGGGIAQGRYSTYFNSIGDGELVRFSPGRLLLLDVIRTCCERGLDRFDLGIGEAGYKAATCDTVDRMFDNFLAVSRSGHIYSQIESRAYALKRSIKQSDWAWDTVQKLRRARGLIAKGSGAPAARREEKEGKGG